MNWERREIHSHKNVYVFKYIKRNDVNNYEPKTTVYSPRAVAIALPYSMLAFVFVHVCVFMFASLRTCSLSLSHTLLYIRPNTIRHEIYFHWSANGTTNKNLSIELLERVRLFSHLSENQRILFSLSIHWPMPLSFLLFLSFQFAITKRYDLILFSVEKKSFDCSIYGRNVGK